MWALDAQDGGGNLDSNPSFADALYRLGDSSPAIDAGSDAGVPADGADLDGDEDLAETTPQDLDNMPRVVGSSVDMGAFERRDGYVLRAFRIGGGSLESDPAGIDCGGTCSAIYPETSLPTPPTSVDLTATAADGFEFFSWLGCDSTCTNPDTCTVLMGADRLVAAVFIPEDIPLVTRLSLMKTGEGKGTVVSDPLGIGCEGDCPTGATSGIDCDEDCGSQTTAYLPTPAPTDAVLTATAAEHSEFAGWNGPCDIGDDPFSCTLVIDGEDRDVQAVFTPKKYLLTVERDGSGTGAVSSGPAGIDCGSDCGESYEALTDVTLTATPGPDSVFSGWDQPGCDSVEPCVVSMDAAKTVTASFSRAYDLTVALEGTGEGSVASSTPDRIECGSDCEETYIEGGSETLTAEAEPGSVFSGWSGACDASSGTCAVAMDGHKWVAATFDLIRHVLTVEKTGDGTGRVTADPSGIDCGDDCLASYPPGAVVNLAGLADAGAVFAGWTGPCTLDGDDCIVTMGPDKTVTASFVPARRLSVSLEGEGSGSVASEPEGIACGQDCVEDFADGVVVDLTPSAEDHSVFAGWNGLCVLDGDVCRVTMDQARSVLAIFEPARYALEIQKDGTGEGTVSSASGGIDCGQDCDEDYDALTEAVLTAGPGDHSTFGGWSGACEGGFAECTVAMDQAKNASAEFVLNSYALTAGKTGNGDGTVRADTGTIDCGDTCEDLFDPKDVVVIEAEADPESIFAGWEGDCQGTDAACELTMDGNKWANAIFHPTDDMDGDGVANDVEDGGLNGGDANCDGIRDAEQGSVASLPGVNGSYVAAVADNGRFELVRALTEEDVSEDDPDPSYDYPLGLVGLTLVSNAAKVTLYYFGEDDLEGSVFRKYGPITPDDTTDEWYDFEAEAGQGCGTATLTLDLEDGAFGDDTGQEGEIRLKGGPVQPAVRLVKTADPATVPEPGATVVFHLKIENLSDSGELTLTELSDDAYGNLDGQGDCALPQVVAAGGAYECDFAALVEGNAGEAKTDKATAMAEIDDRPFEVSDSATVTVTDVPPTISAVKTATPTSVLYPGGVATFAVEVRNTGTAEPVTLTALSDDIHGDLNGQGDCELPQSIAVGDSYRCEFAAEVSGDVGTVETDTVTATAADDEGGTATARDSASVTVVDASQLLSIGKTADPETVPEPVASAVFAVRADNLSATESLTLTSLIDDIHGDLNGQGDCSLPQAIPPEGFYQCSFSAVVSGDAGFVETDTVSAVAEDGEGNDYTARDSATVTVVEGDLSLGTDFGDAPGDSYPTLLADNGARHTIVEGIFLGQGVDAETDGQPNLDADGDDSSGADDEDGVAFATALTICGENRIDVTASAPGILDAWLDLNADGDFDDAGERIFQDQGLLAGENRLACALPCDASPTRKTYARFRFSTTGGLGAKGLASDGEVEDYAVAIEDSDDVPEAVEGAAPGNGDGNADGIDDALQHNVASLPSAVTGEYLTLAVQQECLLREVTAVHPDDLPPDPAGEPFPQGLISFRVTGCDPAEITLICHGETDLATGSYRRYGPTQDNPADHWYTLPAEFGQTVVDGEQKATVSFRIADGELGDDDLSENGTIIDAGAPARSTSDEIPTLSPFALLLLAALLACAGAVMDRRRAEKCQKKRGGATCMKSEE